MSICSIGFPFELEINYRLLCFCCQFYLALYMSVLFLLFYDCALANIHDLCHNMETYMAHLNIILWNRKFTGNFATPKLPHLKNF